jgi:uncharacterized protein YprB with RNaseH-like and TPR domain
MTDSESLFNKLKSMGVQLGSDHLKAQAKPRLDGYGIEQVVRGEDLSTMYGAAFMTRELFPLDHLHGQIPLCSDPDMEVLSAWCGSTRIRQAGWRNVIFLDTETSGLMGGTGTYAFLIGLGYRTEAGFELVQLFMRDPVDEPALLAALDQWLARFDVVVTFNGKTFDVPLLNSRYTMNGLSGPFANYEHVDVLHIARKLWRDRLPSRALGELEKEIVRYYRTTEDIPGWLIPQMYFDYLRSGDARPLSGIFYHNAQDILSLAALYGYIAGMLYDPTHQDQVYGLDLAAIARLYEELGWIDKAAELYERSLQAGDLPDLFFFKTMERFALLHRRQGSWQKAAQLWRKAAEHGEVNACIELAKYYEHQERNPLEALAWARKALENLEVDRYFAGSGQTKRREIERRVGRLYLKVYSVGE